MSDETTYYPADLNRDEVIIWNDTPRPILGLTPFGYWDNDIDLQVEAPKLARHLAFRLGYPIIDIEMQDINFYACIEDAIDTYSNEVNRLNISDNLINLTGTDATGLNLTHREIVPNLGRIIRMANEYGTEAGAGGNVTYRKGFINIETNQQTYDLNKWASDNGYANDIEIKKIYHHEKPAISTFYQPITDLGGAPSQGMFGAAGMNVLMPLYDDLLVMQSVEMNNRIRKSAYSFELINNQLKLFPSPNQMTKLYFDFILISERNNPINDNDTGNKISDVSNAPFNRMQYNKINHTGRQWIKEYSLGNAKEMLGLIRSKYSSIPIPNSEITLDGDMLRNEGNELKNSLLEQLRELLDKSSRQQQLERKQAESESLQEILTHIPMKIYVG